MKRKYYITTPIYYVNDVPHIGHAYTTLASDVIARFMRLADREVKFLTGTDEHGQKVEKSANNLGIDPQSFTDKVSLSFRKLFSEMNISNDDFIRTTEDRHKKAVEHLWKKLVDNGHIYLGKYSGWYSIRDEAFYNESELTADGLAPTGAPVEWVEEPSYFFNLSKWQDKLLEFYDQNPDFIKPETRRNEVISFVKSGLTDLSVSRTSFSWGIKVPGDNKHIVYVWLDALTNYISALGYPETFKVKGKDQEGYWPANVHVVGKDILRFHAVYWPAFLMAADIELPKAIMAHGWWTNEGQKISKSLGNVIDPFKLIEEFGLDQVRYFLMREVIFGNDGNYVRENMVNRVNSELANKIGNLAQRTLSFINKNCDSKIPQVSEEFIKEAYEMQILENTTRIANDTIKQIENFEINNYLDNIIFIAEEANAYIDREAPWQLKKTNLQKMNEVLYVLLELIRHIAILLQAITPDSANMMLNQLGIPQDSRQLSYIGLRGALVPNTSIPEPKPIFPRIE